MQDDWDVNGKLLLNLGVRWDYEETPSYLDFVTPADVVAGLNTPDPGAPGQTYAQTLALGGVDVNDYISTGNNRDAFDGAIQPRFGFSYDLLANQRHVIFGGAGRSYDRNVFDYVSLEESKGTFPTLLPIVQCARSRMHAGRWRLPRVGSRVLRSGEPVDALVAANPQLGREINLIHNDISTPYSDQFSFGMRNRVELWRHDWNTSASVVVRGVAGWHRLPARQSLSGRRLSPAAGCDLGRTAVR